MTCTVCAPIEQWHGGVLVLLPLHGAIAVGMGLGCTPQVSMWIWKPLTNLYKSLLLKATNNSFIKLAQTVKVNYLPCTHSMYRNVRGKRISYFILTVHSCMERLVMDSCHSSISLPVTDTPLIYLACFPPYPAPSGRVLWMWPSHNSMPSARWVVQKPKYYISCFELTAHTRACTLRFIPQHSAFI